ncbi:MAG: T9SS type A sorting domain-containing protein [Schleiferiaceae bacterium]|jgi:hypothetical protein|nr:T9SS type A sorting domain-containing protein [Schleiferiaceae bacterium]
MKTLSSTLAFLVSVIAFSQSSINSTGGEANGLGGKVSYSIGQIDYTSQTSNTGNLNLGVQQPYEFFNISTLENELPQLSVSALPNPTVNNVVLTLKTRGIKCYSYLLTDSRGKELIKNSIQQTETEIEMSHLADAIYFLTVIKNGEVVQSFKIIKNQ